MPFLSIVIITYDGDFKYLSRILDFIKNRVFVSYEVIIIDNRESNKEQIKLFDNVKIFPQHKNLLQFEGRRRSIPLCNGKYIWFVDCDDEIFMVKRDLESLITSDVICFSTSEKSEIIKLSPFVNYRKYYLGNDRIYTLSQEEFKKTEMKFGRLCCVTLWNKWIKKDILLDIYKTLPENERIVASEDVFYVCAALYRSKNIQICSDFIYMYNRGLSKGAAKTVTFKNFNHIIIGYDKSRELINSIPDEYYHTDTIVDVSYFISRIRILEENDKTKDALKIIIQYFSKTEIIDGVNNLIDYYKKEKKEDIYNFYYNLKLEVIKL